MFPNQKSFTFVNYDSRQFSSHNDDPKIVTYSRRVFIRFATA